MNNINKPNKYARGDDWSWKETITTTTTTKRMPKKKRKKKISNRILELISKHGSLRAVSRVLCIDVAYLARLRDWNKNNPSRKILSKLGLLNNYTHVEMR